MMLRRGYVTTTGDFVIVEPIAEGNKVQAEIIHILYPLQIKNLKEMSKWYIMKYCMLYKLLSMLGQKSLKILKQ